tara:strand:- start:287 stop:538 length:252 start_codon:yes stop_codon:yes gene_type:complete
LDLADLNIKRIIILGIIKTTNLKPKISIGAKPVATPFKGYKKIIARSKYKSEVKRKLYLSNENFLSEKISVPFLIIFKSFVLS